MKNGSSSLNPYAASYVPLSKRGVGDPGQELLPSGRENVLFGNQPANALTHFQQQNAPHSYLHHPGSFPKWNDHPASEFYASSSQNQEHVQAKSNINQEFVDLSYLKMKFPGISEESLTDVYLANSCDLDASVDMLNQLELYPDDASDKLPDTLDIGDVVETSSPTLPESLLMASPGASTAGSSKSASIRYVQDFSSIEQRSYIRPRMWKQFIGKLHKKSHHKSNQDSTSNPNLGPNPSSSNSIIHSPSVKRASAAVFPASLIAGIEPLLAFKDVPSTEKMNLFISKLSLCSAVFDFTDPAKNVEEKELKRATLFELIDFVSQNPPPMLTEPAILASCNMCSVNLFRAFAPNKRSSTGEPENGDEPSFDPAWPYLQIVYDFLLKLVTSPSLEPRVAKQYLDHAFILKLIDLFDSEDPRERECLKTILHRIYGKFMVHRPFIRKSISNVFYSFVFETEKHHGISELLEIFGSVITGFALPLKEEHKMFLSRVLIPLHKPKPLVAYSKQLMYCVGQFVEKDPTLASVVVFGMLKCWPIISSQKEVIFLIELDEILEIIDRSEFRKVMVPLFSRVSRCISSDHFQVAEKALSLLNNEQIIDQIMQNRQVLFPVLIPAIECNTRNHWNKSVLNTTLNVRKVLSGMDQTLFCSCLLSNE